MERAQLNTTLKELLIALVAFAILFLISTSLYAMMKEKSHERIKDAAGLLSEFSRETSNIVVVSGRVPSEDEISKVLGFTMVEEFITSAKKDEIIKYLKSSQQKYLQDNIFVVILPYSVQNLGIEDFEVLDEKGTLRITLQSGSVIDFTNALQNLRVFLNTSTNLIVEETKNNKKEYYLLNSFGSFGAYAKGSHLNKKGNAAFILRNNRLYFMCGEVLNYKFMCGQIIFKGEGEDRGENYFAFESYAFDTLIHKNNIKVYEFDVQKFLEDHKNGK